MDEPAPMVIMQNFGESGIEFLVYVWAERANFLTVKSSIFQDIKEAFEKEKIEIPFPHVSLHKGQASA